MYLFKNKKTKKWFLILLEFLEVLFRGQSIFFKKVSFIVLLRNIKQFLEYILEIVCLLVFSYGRP